MAVVSGYFIFGFRRSMTHPAMLNSAEMTDSGKRHLDARLAELIAGEDYDRLVVFKITDTMEVTELFRWVKGGR